MGRSAGKRTIDLNRFYSDVGHSLRLGKKCVFNFQVREVLGGIANLYLEQVLESQKKAKLVGEQMQFGVVLGFVPCDPSLFTIEQVLIEIGNCTGLKRDKSWQLLLAMSAIFRKHVLKLGISRRNTVLFSFGKFRLPPAGSIADYVMVTQYEIPGI